MCLDSQHLCLLVELHSFPWSSRVRGMAFKNWNKSAPEILFTGLHAEPACTIWKGFVYRSSKSKSPPPQEAHTPSTTRETGVVIKKHGHWVNSYDGLPKEIILMKNFIQILVFVEKPSNIVRKVHVLKLLVNKLLCCCCCYSKKSISSPPSGRV